MIRKWQHVAMSGVGRRGLCHPLGGVWDPDRCDSGHWVMQRCTRLRTGPLLYSLWDFIDAMQPDASDGGKWISTFWLCGADGLRRAFWAILMIHIYIIHIWYAYVICIPTCWRQVRFGCRQSFFTRHGLVDRTRGSYVPRQARTESQSPQRTRWSIREYSMEEVVKARGLSSLSDAHRFRVAPSISQFSSYLGCWELCIPWLRKMDGQHSTGQEPQTVIGSCLGKGAKACTRSGFRALGTLIFPASMVGESRVSSGQVLRRKKSWTLRFRSRSLRIFWFVRSDLIRFAPPERRGWRTWRGVSLDRRLT